jgi:hypothetical protein
MRSGAGGFILPGMKQFDEFRASELYCPQCRTARPVRERLLLVLPTGDLHEYRCAVCSTSLATRETRTPPVAVARPPAGPGRAAAGRAGRRGLRM